MFNIKQNYSKKVLSPGSFKKYCNPFIFILSLNRMIHSCTASRPAFLNNRKCKNEFVIEQNY